MKKLQKPEFVFMQGKMIRWDEASVHIGCEAVTRGLNVFEGIKGYWQTNGSFGLIFLRQHYQRLLRSAKLLHLPCPWTYEEFEDAAYSLIGSLLKKEKDMWIRTTLLAIEGNWGEGTKTDLVMTAYHQDMEEPQPINLGISTWQRGFDNVLPARIKTSTNYQVGRLARIEGKANDYEDMVLLNQWGRVAEATGSCIIIVRDGVLYSPPATEGALESITLDFIENLANSLNIKFIRRPIDRTELLVADEISICGTLAELIPVKKIDLYPIEPYGPLLTSIREKFFKVVRGEEMETSFDISIIPNEKILFNYK